MGGGGGLVDTLARFLQRSEAGFEGVLLMLVQELPMENLCLKRHQGLHGQANHFTVTGFSLQAQRP